MQPAEKLKVWRNAHTLAVEIHRVTAEWPDRDLRNQVRRSAVSVGANITEGAAAPGRPQFARFLAYAYASAAELRYHLLFARDVGFIPAPLYADLDSRAEENCKMLTGLVRTVRNAVPQRRP